jgi:hypothetical protein
MFDDGTCNIYKISNTAEAGNMPKQELVYFASHWYEEKTIGVTRFYAALKGEVKLDILIRIWQDKEIESSHICIIDEVQFRIAQVQHTKNEDGLDVTDLSLERVGDFYDLSQN